VAIPAKITERPKDAKIYPIIVSSIAQIRIILSETIWYVRDSSVPSQTGKLAVLIESGAHLY
jgi:hypothetical protein